MMGDVLARTPRTARAESSALDRAAKRIAGKQLASICGGQLTLVDGARRERFGDAAEPLAATVFVEDPRFYRALAFRGALGGAEAYLSGWWRSDDLASVVRILSRSRRLVRDWQRGIARWTRPALAAYHALHRNSRAGSRRNIAAHYDLGNDFFRAFLDPTLTYSSGIFESADASMEQASIAKYERVCDKLRLGAGDRVLEIGGGWGGFALHAARTRGCFVTTATISRAQYELARERVAAAGLTRRIDVLLADYRELRGRHDRLVSLEMIEAVGRDHLEDYFRICSERLESDGVMLLQAITVPDADYDAHTRTVDFIKRYIFPGADLVSLLAIARAAAAASGELRITHLEDLTPHYAETLRCWRSRMFENVGALRRLGLDDRFLRMWEFYLCYCEGGFEERAIGVAQIVFEKPAVRRSSILGSLR
jgi:cyclopropane-fatty-acyl-phospholipid synthase